MSMGFLKLLMMIDAVVVGMMLYFDGDDDGCMTMSSAVVDRYVEK